MQNVGRSSRVFGFDVTHQLLHKGTEENQGKPNRCRRNISGIYKKFFVIKILKNSTLRLRSKLLPSSGETTNPNTQLAKKYDAHINIIHTRETKTNTSKNIHIRYAKPINNLKRQ
jgi:hypothetical protein